MAHSLSFTDGTTTLTFTAANGYQVERYPLTAPDLNTQTVESAWLDGGEVTQVDQRNVPETIELLAIGSSKTDLQDKIRALESMFLTARRRQQTGVGAIVTASLQLDGEASAWETEVLFGRVSVDPDMLNLWPNVKTPVRLFFTRRYYWEGTEATLANATSINNGSGNVVTLSTVSGVLPAPANITIENTNGGTIGWHYFFLSNDAYNGFTGTQHQITVSDSDSWSSSTHSTARATVTVPDAVIAKCNGLRFHVAGLFSVLTSECYMKLTLYQLWSGFYYKLSEGPEVYPAGIEVVDFGVFQLPPSEELSSSNLVFRLSVYEEDSGQYVLDALQLMPADDFLRLFQQDQVAAAGDSVVWDGRNNRGYVLESGGDTYAMIEYQGGGLEVHPGQTNKLMVTFEDNGDYTSTRTMDVTVTYRPRRLTV